MKKTSRKTFTEDIKSNKFVLVDFYADWCNPCKVLKKTLESIEDKRLSIFFINIGDDPDFIDELNITAVPTLMYYNDGILMERRAGTKSKTDILKKFNSYETDKTEL